MDPTRLPDSLPAPDELSKVQLTAMPQVAKILRRQGKTVKGTDLLPHFHDFLARVEALHITLEDIRALDQGGGDPEKLGTLLQVYDELYVKKPVSDAGVLLGLGTVHDAALRRVNRGPAVFDPEEATVQEAPPSPPNITPRTVENVVALGEIFRAPEAPVPAPHGTAWRWAAGLSAAAALVLGAVAYHDQTPETKVVSSPVAAMPMPVTQLTPHQPEVSAPAQTGPVYAQVLASFADDHSAEKDLKVAATTKALEDGLYEEGPSTWEDVKALHAWSDSPKALTRLEWHMDQWGPNRGGYEAVLLSGDRADCHATTIDELLKCVESDPAIPHGAEVAKNVAETVTGMLDERIMPDQGAVLELHKKMETARPAMVAEINKKVTEGSIKAPQPFHYPTASTALTEASFGALYEAPEPMNVMADMSEFLEEEDVEDVSAYLEEIDATDVVEPLHVKSASTAMEHQAVAHIGLNGLATWMENSQSDLLKKARGKNRELLPAFCAGVAEDLRVMGQRFDGLNSAGQEVALLDLKQKFFARMDGLKNGDGHFKSGYLKDLSLQFNSALAEMLPGVQGVEGVQGRTRREVLATLPEGMFRA